MTPIESLEKLGYCRLTNQYSKEDISRALDLLKSYDIKLPAGEEYERSPRLNRDALNCYNLQNKDPHFVKMLFSPPRVEEILKYFLNDPFYAKIEQFNPNYILRAFTARSTGSASLPWHIDSMDPGGVPTRAMQVAIFLEDSTIENGCTRVIPGSHLSGEYASQDQNLSKVVHLEAKAGDVLMWNGAIHHSTGPNKTTSTRWSMIYTMSKWWLRQAYDIPASLPKETLALLSPKEKHIMGFGVIPPYDESVRLDVKQGYL